MIKKFNTTFKFMQKVFDDETITPLHFICKAEIQLLQLRARVHIPPPVPPLAPPQFDEVFINRYLRIATMLGERQKVKHEQAK